MDSQQPSIHPPLHLSNYSKRVLLKTILTRPEGGAALFGHSSVVVGGWVRSAREFRKEPSTTTAVATTPSAGNAPASCVEVIQTKLPFFRTIVRIFGGEQRIREKFDAILPKVPAPQPSISILHINDGSCPLSLQVLVDPALAPPGRVMPTGTCILVEGTLQKPSLQGKDAIELRADKILHIGIVDSDRYPLSKKRLPLESLRDFAHFRQRTTTVSSVMRVRNELTHATYAFFKENDFLHVQVPIITTTNSEGLRENFQITTRLIEQRSTDRTEGIDPETIRASIRDKNKKIEELKRSESNKEALDAATHDLTKAKELLSQLETEEKGKSIRSPAQTSRASLSDEFFGGKTYLTTSGRLHLESYAAALGNVYAFGPRFCASRCETRKTLAEMWMVEIEMAFSELQGSMECAEDFLKFLCKWILDNCKEDVKFIWKRIDKHVVDRLQLITSTTFEKITYSEAIEILKRVTNKRFETRVEWGIPLSEEAESYLADEVYKKPIILYNHPKEVKPFYVRVDDNAGTVSSFDLILPKIGSVIRGSQSEERFNVLRARIEELGLEKQRYEWYLDLRRHGAMKCSGFTFLFDPLVLYATGLNDVRDAVPFPRSFGKINN